MNDIQIKFISCSNPNSWYKNKVGNTFELNERGVFIENYDEKHHAIKGKILNCLIKKEDCVITKTTVAQ